MTNEKIKEEFGRWIDANRPKMWYKYRKQKWLQIENPTWVEDVFYVVGDEYAEVRKAFYDGKQIQYKIRDEWINCPGGEPRWVLKPEDYRVKPDTEPAYEWQWLMYADDKYWITPQFFTSKDEVLKFHVDGVVEKYEPSKRERK